MTGAAAGPPTGGQPGGRPPAVDRGALWLHLATEDAVRLANAGDAPGARARVADASRAGDVLVAAGLVDPSVLHAWRDDTADALAARGIGVVELPPWWSSAPRHGSSPPERGLADLDDDGLASLVRWLASTLLAGWPAAVADRARLFALVIDALRYAGARGPRFEEGARAAAGALEHGRFPRGWPAPPTGPAQVGTTALDAALGRGRLLSLTAHDDHWELEVDGVATPALAPWWAVDDAAGLYFGSSSLADALVRVRFQPGLSAAAGQVTVRLGTAGLAAEVDLGALS